MLWLRLEERACETIDWIICAASLCLLLYLIGV